ncbi:MAG: hypothetical protein WDZ38_06355, partial [Balneolaceae bacterium]
MIKKRLYFEISSLTLDVLYVETFVNPDINMENFGTGRFLFTDRNNEELVIRNWRLKKKCTGS